MAEINKKIDQHTTKNNAAQLHEKSSETHILYLLPILIIVAILPLIMRLHLYDAHLSEFTWFADGDEYADFFLYYKQVLFISLSAFMALVAVYRTYTNRRTLKFPRVFVPLAVYALLALISSLLSKYKYFSFHGIFEQFESVFVLLGYSLTVYYVYLIVQSEKDVEFIIRALLISSIILGIIGLTQISGNDFFTSSQGWKMITSRGYWNTKDLFNFNFLGTTYLTLYNPNYVGTYAAMILPILIISAAISSKLLYKLAFLVAALGIIISLIGSKSATGIVSVLFGFILALILFRRYLIKYLYVSIPAIIIIIISLVIFNNKYDNFIVNQYHKVTNIQKSTPVLTDIQTADNNLIIKYNNNTLQIDFYVTEDGICNFNVYDGDFMPVDYITDTVNGPATLQDARFPGFVLTPCRNADDALAFSVSIEGYLWYFTNQVLNHSYYHINSYGKYDKIMTAPSALFKGYEKYASGRGYIWSRTIPLLADKFLLGSGADTFIFEFPHEDYVYRWNYRFIDDLITKPHNLYLQIGVQTGVISLIAFIAFYVIYFISSISLYIKGKFDGYSSYIGIAILIGTSSYMITGITNDSSISVAPVFWALMGLGIAVNRIVRKEKTLAKQI